MKRSTTRLAAFGSAALALALGLGTTVSVQAEEATTSTAQPDQEIQDRAVPRMMNPDAQFEQMQRPPRMRQGFVRQGNNIVAQPGYVLEPGPNNQVTVRMASGDGSAGGGQGATHQCSCVHNDVAVKFETCTTTVIGTKATSQKGTGDCQDTCQWISTTTGVSPTRKSMQ